jgi:hypothetical protein
MKRGLLFVLALLVLALGAGFGVPARAQVTQNDVIVNEFLPNPAAGVGKEFVELLVTKVGGVDLRGWSLSDLGSKGAPGAATEGRLTFPGVSAFQNVPRGTRIVVVLEVPSANTNSYASEDLDPSDGQMVAFTSVLAGGTLVPAGVLDLSTNENIELLTDSTASSTAIDFVATGTNASAPNFPECTWPSNTTGGGGDFYFTNNAGGGLNNDSSAVGWFAAQPQANATPGSLNPGQSMPGSGPSDGSGTAALGNATVGSLNGTTIFLRNTASQSVTVTVTGVSGGTLDKVKLTVPTSWGTYSSGNVTFGGAFAGKTPTYAGRDITVNSAALGTTPGTISISGLTSPNPVGAGLSGFDEWTVQTATSGGTLTDVSLQPGSNTIIPISNMRQGGLDGYGNTDLAGTTPVMTNSIVAVRGVVTIANRVLAETTSTTIFIQDGNYGVQIFKGSSNSYHTLLLGNDIIVKGSVLGFGGNTEVQPNTVSFPDIVNLGAGALPSPFILTNAVAVAESTEGRLVKFNSVTWDSAGSTFIATATNVSKNNFSAAGNQGTLYLNAVNTLIGNSIPASSPLTGVVYHRSDISGNQALYKVSPRDQVDLGQNAADGTGTAVIAPVARLSSQTGVAETLTVTAGAFTLASVSVEIPSSWTWDGSSRTLTGAGFSGAISSVTGNGSAGTPWVITITGATLSGANTGTVRIANLGTPSVLGSTGWTTSTAGVGGSLTAITTSPTVNISTAFEAQTSGNWSSPATWAGGAVPGAGDDVSMSTLGVTVTIDISNAQCNSLTMTGSGTAASSGPVLQFQATGTPQLTVNGPLTVSGGSGGGGGDRGGRAKLTSNGNASATLVLKKTAYSTCSNSTTNDNAGLNMNEGTVKFIGSGSDSIRAGAGLRLGNLQIGDGVTPKTITTIPSVSTSTLTIHSLVVKQGSTLSIGTPSTTNVLTIGTPFNNGLPYLNGGIIVENGATLNVQESSAGAVTASINLDGGGITNNGTIDLANATCTYSLKIGGFPGGSSGVTETIAGTSAGEYADVVFGDTTGTLALNQDMVIAPGHALTVNSGTLSETPGNTVIGTATATRTLSQSVNETFGGLGLEINAAGGAPGATVVSRQTGTAVTSGSSESILRWFDIAPANNTGLNAAMNFYYNTSELNGNNANVLKLYKSTDAGSNWSDQGGTANPGLGRVELTGVQSFSRWTAADTANPLGSATLNVAYGAGWNMVSNPVVTANDSVTDIFPASAFSYAFAFVPASGYQQRYVLAHGLGYWAKFPSAGSASMSDPPRTADTIAVAVGWNMIGSIGSAVDTGTIIANPVGIRASQYFGYSGSYTPVTVITSGKGYWVKANAAGSFIITAGSVPARENVADPLAAFGRLTITDAAGASQTLYLGEDHDGTFPTAFYEMPPAGPEGTFDARFVSGGMVDTWPGRTDRNSTHAIDLHGAAWPVTLAWELPQASGRTFRIDAGAGEKPVTSSGRLVLANASVRRITVSSTGAGVPAEFSLGRNYPNPFNPSTNIRFGLPADARVTVRVYNLLGQQIAQIAGGVYSAGYHDVTWEGRTDAGMSVGSGVYFCRLEATALDGGRAFSDIRKMMLVR